MSMIGISYGGFTSLQVASLAPPHLTSIVPVDFTDDRYRDDCHYKGGLLRKYYDPGSYGNMMVAFNAMPPDLDSSAGAWAQVWEQHLAENTPYVLPWLRHQTDGPYWRTGSVAPLISCWTRWESWASADGGGGSSPAASSRRRIAARGPRISCSCSGRRSRGAGGSSFLWLRRGLSSICIPAGEPSVHASPGSCDHGDNTIQRDPRRRRED